MGGLLSSLYVRQDSRLQREAEDVEVIKVDELLDAETLVPQILEYATKDVHRDTLYACDFYRELDKRVPLSGEPKEVVWRMNVDHPIVYVLVADLGQQPVHVVKDVYGDLVVYEDAEVQEAVRLMRKLCGEAGYEVRNEPAPPLQEEEEKESEVNDE